MVAVAGAAVYGERVHKLDDLARDIGLEPRRLPATSDETLIKSVQTDLSDLLLSTRSVARRQPGLAKTLAPLIDNTAAQLLALGGAIDDLRIGTPPASILAAHDRVITAHTRAAAKLSKQSLEAVSGDFAQVLASIAVSLSQSVVVLRNARRAIA